MRKRRNRTRTTPPTMPWSAPASTPVTTSPVLPMPPAPQRSTWEPVVHHVPSWVKFWVTPQLPNRDVAIQVLHQVHGDLLREAERGPGEKAYLRAAERVHNALKLFTFPMSPQYREIDIVEPISEFLMALMGALRDWDDSTTASSMHNAFALADGWFNHAESQQRAGGMWSLEGLVSIR